MNPEEEAILAELDEQFGAELGNIDAKASDQLPKMKCALSIESAYLNKSATSGRKQLTIACVIVETDGGDEFVGKKYKKNWGLETEENISWFKKDLRGLELAAPKTPKDIIALCQTLEGLAFTGSMVPNTDAQYPPNCYINEGARRHDLEGGIAKASAKSDLG